MPKTAARALLTDFLKTRRARLHPAVFGITEEGDPRRRRSAGLRRSEVARLAGISTEWYTLFEMGQERAMTVRIIEPVAHALQLNEDERDYLYDLVRGEPPPREPEGIFPSLVTALGLVGDIMIAVFDRWLTPVAWNLSAEAILALEDEEPLHTNTLWRLFFRRDVRRMHVQWEERAAVALGLFRRALGRDPANPQALGILAVLLKDPEFERMWSAHEVVSLDSDARRNARRTYHMHHPQYGIFAYQAIGIPLPAFAGGFLWLGSPSDDVARRVLATATARHIAEQEGRRLYGRRGLFDAVELENVGAAFAHRHPAGDGDDLADLGNSV